ncbi:hypothetical protein ECANGB1_1675 [Enterospora canceri]|uniref:Uncharacterized protein n=1 Tax=Enterospora canceri TaxID=1081671 RepID=A0A1Y1SA16_9MICR|nr:hypothetical protein ECANGB1_1675 [Enterospora canceri]
MPVKKETNKDSKMIENKMYKKAARSVATFLNAVTERSKSTETESDTIKQIGKKRQELNREMKTESMGVKTGAYKSGKESKSVKKAMKNELNAQDSKNTEGANVTRAAAKTESKKKSDTKRKEIKKRKTAAKSKTTKSKSTK